MEKNDIDFDSSDDMFELVFNVSIDILQPLVLFNRLFLQFRVERDTTGGIASGRRGYLIS